MKKIFIAIISFLGINGTFAAIPKADFNVIPIPQKIELSSSTPFILNNKTKIYYQKGLERNAAFLQHYIEDICGINLKLTKIPQRNNVISLIAENNAAANAEKYTLIVNKKRIHITGNSPEGVFYGIQTLRKSLPILQTCEVEIPAGKVEDSPRFSYRGVHLDVSRHFFPADSIKKYIDIIALHNGNYFHWHLTDDQGWRIEIKSRPKLTSIGSCRAQTNGDGKQYCGFYTQNEIRDIVKYAQDRYITIIPEIDVPGHTTAALASYPELGCTGGPYKVWEVWGGPADVLCAGNSETMNFLHDVFSEIVDLFPSKYIHIGGDECPKERWKVCPKCQAKIKELRIVADSTHSAEQKLQSYIMVSVENFLAKKGRRVIGWDEILEGGLGPDAIVHSWRGMEGAVEAVHQGHDAILSPTSHCYFDYDQEERTPIDKVYSFQPVPEEFDSTEVSHILGVQANVWTEYMPTFERVQYMLLPRLAALSEVQWSEPERMNYTDFLHRLTHLSQLYDKYGYNYAK
ncbi:MAG: beta-N-acetylhexosaminidase [Paludibacter sp.]|nr:beta-N-acetylhexosaminidase [Paludibacter sp.]